MGCPPVRGDNPRASASGLSYGRVEKHGITILYHLFYTTYISVDLARHEIFRAKVGKGGIKVHPVFRGLHSCAWIWKNIELI